MHTTDREELHRLVDALPEKRVANAMKELTEIAAESPVEQDTHIGPSLSTFGETRSVTVAPAISTIDELHGDFWPEDEDSHDIEMTICR